jgi:putative nucleotidyltransferase with HDIG domain
MDDTTEKKKNIVGYVAHNVVDKSGRLLLAEGTALTPEVVRKMQKRGLEFRISAEALASSASLKPVLKNNNVKLFKVPKKLDEKIERLDRECIDHAARYLNKVLNHVRDNVFLSDNLKILAQGHKATYSHSINVSLITVAIARKLNYSTSSLHEIALGALYHDIGKILLPRTVLNDVTGVCDGQTLIYQQHTVLGSDLLTADMLPRSVSLVALQHHERNSGNGYPGGLKGSEIHLNSAIVIVADVFDRLTSAIFQQNVLSPEEAIQQIVLAKDIDYHPQAVDMFVELFKQ